MSAFAICVEHDGAEPAAQAIEPMLDALDHRGVNGRHLVRRSGAALGHQHFWTTPEEVGEKQPVHDAASGIDVVLDGRIDNREELAGKLGLATNQLSRTSDASLVLHAFLKWDEHCFERLLGPFAIAVFDARRRRTVCGRDALGDRSLFYHRTSSSVLIASEEQALLAHPAVSARLNETTVALFFAIAAPLEGATFFEDIHALPPGHAMIVQGSHVRLWRHWRPEELPDRSRCTDDERIEEFRSLLTDSVRCRLRCIGRPAVLMSGGLDSTSVAALAARELKASNSPQALRTISWVFDELTACDEREFIEAMVDDLTLDPVYITADHLWPMKDIDLWTMSANAPQRGMYQDLTSKAWDVVLNDGGQTILDGVYGDQLYASADFWLRDLLAEGRIGEAAKRTLGEIVHYRSGRDRRVWFRAALARLVCRSRGRVKRHNRPWLNSHARDLILAGPDHDNEWTAHDRPAVARSLLDPLWSSATSVADACSGRAGVDVRRPCRDRRLVENALRMPGHLTYRGGWTKRNLRIAMEDVLPEKVRLRTKATSLLSLAARGMADREYRTLKSMLKREGATWQKYVRQDWMAQALSKMLKKDSVEALVPWHCVCMENWRSKHADIWGSDVH